MPLPFFPHETETVTEESRLPYVQTSLSHSTPIGEAKMNFTNEPPEDSSVPYPLMRTPRGGKLAFICLTDTYTGVYTHYDGEKTIECPPGGTCSMCKAGKTNRWQGYVLGRIQGQDTVSLIHFTNMAVSMIGKALKGDRNWLYRKIVFQRGNSGDNAPLRAYLFGVAQGEERVPIGRLHSTVRSIYKANGVAPTTPISDSLPSNG